MEKYWTARKKWAKKTTEDFYGDSLKSFVFALIPGIGATMAIYLFGFNEDAVIQLVGLLGGFVFEYFTHIFYYLFQLIFISPNKLFYSMQEKLLYRAKRWALKNIGFILQWSKPFGLQLVIDNRGSRIITGLRVRLAGLENISGGIPQFEMDEQFLPERDLVNILKDNPYKVFEIEKKEHKKFAILESSNDEGMQFFVPDGVRGNTLGFLPNGAYKFYLIVDGLVDNEGFKIILVCQIHWGSKDTSNSYYKIIERV